MGLVLFTLPHNTRISTNPPRFETRQQLEKNNITELNIMIIRETQNTTAERGISNNYLICIFLTFGNISFFIFYCATQLTCLVITFFWLYLHSLRKKEPKFDFKIKGEDYLT